MNSLIFGIIFSDKFWRTVTSVTKLLMKKMVLLSSVSSSVFNQNEIIFGGNQQHTSDIDSKHTLNLNIAEEWYFPISYTFLQ